MQNVSKTANKCDGSGKWKHEVWYLTLWLSTQLCLCLMSLIQHLKKLFESEAWSMVYISLYNIEGFDELNMKLLYLDCVKSLIDMFLYHIDNFKLKKKHDYIKRYV